MPPEVADNLIDYQRFDDTKLEREPFDYRVVPDFVPPPVAGMQIAFRRAANPRHGHTSYDGPRWAIMLNWMTDAVMARREARRHAPSAGVKRRFGAA